MVLVLGGALWIWLKGDPAAFAEWRREAHPAWFFTALALLPAIGFPTTPFFMLAGATFSPLENTIGITVSLGANVALSYWLANSGLRPVFLWLLKKCGREMPVLDNRSKVRFALLVKMTPGLPTFLKTYVIGMSGISFPLYFIICFSVTACYAFAFVILGDSLVERDIGSGALSIGIVLAIMAVLYLVRRKLKKPRSG